MDPDLAPPDLKAVDLAKAPRDCWGRRKYLLSEYSSRVLELSTWYVRKKYRSRETLEASFYFIENSLMDAPQSDLSLLTRMGFFPWLEAQHELNAALDQTLLGFHRASHDHQRRSLELILVGTWFVSGQTTDADAADWMSARSGTPYFKKTLERLSKEDLYAELEAKTGWVDDVQNFYWSLSDISHVRGTPHGVEAVQPRNFSFNGYTVPQFSEDALRKALDSFTTAVGYIALLIALSNPVLLFGLPIEEKFGINGPVSGFFEDGQAENLRTLIPERHRTELVTLADADGRVGAIRDYFSSRPNMTEQEIEAQVEDFRQQLAQCEDSSSSE